ncbi:MAG: signal peptidase I [Prevotella sp.]|nr:signal peptidase I [Prevotella sp.]
MMKKEKKKTDIKKQWAKFVIVLILYLLFLLWVKSWLGLIVVPFIYDAYISKKINWKWWQDAEGPTRTIMSWVDAIVFALVAVYFINQFFFQNYVIPSSSLEKSLLTGDYLFVSKVSYGPRIPETPLTVPLTQHTLPFGEIKSYIEWPHWEYRRVKGLGQVERNDIVVFNYPAGDTIFLNQPYQTEYYSICQEVGRSIYDQMNPFAEDLDSLPVEQQFQRLSTIQRLGSDYLKQNPNFCYNGVNPVGEVGTRPTDRRENYVKRCVGLPGDTLEIKDRVVYIDGVANKEPDQVQYTYFVKFNNMSPLALLKDDMDELRKELGISIEDVESLKRLQNYDTAIGSVLNPKVLSEFDGYMPLTNHAVKELKNRGYISNYRVVTDKDIESGTVYPLTKNSGWTRDNYGPVWIPKKGESIHLNMDNIAIYERPIRAYEKNELEVRDGKIFINGEETDTYTFKMDYYWMMGDNRHNSADSRYWGFVPEDHVVGKPIFIWWSSDPDRSLFGGGIRWGRLFNLVDNIK